jgi:hypothetical protein
MGWGNWANNAPPTLSSGLGSPGGGGGWGSWAQASAAAQPGTGGGGVGWLGSLTNPLGIVSGAKDLATGIAKGVATPFVYAAEGVGKTLGNLGALATGNADNADWSGALHDFTRSGQGVGDWAGFAVTSAENLGSDIAHPLGALSSSLGGPDIGAGYDSEIQGFNRWFSGEYGKAGHNRLLSPEMNATLQGKNKEGLAPTDFAQASQQGGLATGIATTALQAAIVAAPFAGAASAIAGDAADAGAMAAARGAVEDAARYQSRAATAGKVAAVAEAAAHPVQTATGALGGIGYAARNAIAPAEVTTPLEPMAGPAPIEQVPVTVPDQVQAIDSVLHPETATKSNTGYLLGAELQRAITEAAAQHEAKPLAEAAPAASGMTRLYNGGQNAEAMWTSDINRAESYRNTGVGENAGKVRYVDVPDALAKQLKTSEGSAAHVEAMAAGPEGNQPNTATDYYLGNHPELAAKSVEHPAPKLGKTEAPPVEPKIAPEKLNVAKGRPQLAPEEIAQRFDELRQAETAARATDQPHVHALTELAARLAEPPPGWATKIAEVMPDSVNQVLSHFADIADKRRIVNAYRNVEQVMETAQNIARSSPAMRAGESAARTLLSKEMTRAEASRIIGEELRARLTGNAMVAEYVQAHAGEMPNAAQLREMYTAARGQDIGLTDAILQPLSDTKRAELQAHLDSAVDGFRALQKETLQRLVATRYGAKGLESAILGDRSAMMSTDQVRMYKKAMLDYATAEKLRQRTQERVALERNVSRQEVLGERTYGVINDLRAKLGVTEQTIQQLFQPIPKGLANDGQATIAAMLNEIAANPENPGATIDVGSGEAVHPSQGIAISMADQRTVPDAEWQANAAAIIHDVLFNPKSPDSGTYAPERLWGGADARLGVWRYNAAPDGAPPDYQWALDVSMSTNNGKPIELWQAYVLGEGFKQMAGWDFGRSTEVPFSQDPNVQDLSAHFIGQALDPRSDVAKFADQLAHEGNTPEQVAAGVMNRIAVDQSFGERAPLYQAQGAHDPLSAQYTPVRGDINVRQARWESDAAFAQRARQYGEARASAEGLQQRIRMSEQRAAQVNKQTLYMQGLLLEPTRSELIAAKLANRADDTLARLASQLDQAGSRQIPQAWRPLMEAWTRLAEEAKKDESGAMLQLLDEIPQTFSAVLQHAAEAGFEPTHVPDLTWQMANKYLFHHVNVGGTVAEAGIRKENTGTLSKLGLANRSLEALGVASVIAMRENLQNQLVSFIEGNYARSLDPNTPIPKGWRSWDAARNNIILGRTVEGETVATNANKIIPEAVYKALKGVTKPVPDMPFRFLFKGGPIAVWKNLLLTWSPSWYIKHFIGAVSLATFEGAGFHDWMTAWQQFKTDTLPDVVKGRSIYQVLDNEVGRSGIIIPRNRLTDLPDLVRSEGYKQAALEINAKLKNVVKTVDGLARAAVYERTLRTGGSVDLAASRAYEAIGDFGRLTPLERGIVTNIIPFYAFQKSMFRILAKLPAEHPLAAGLLMQAGIMHQAYMKELLGGSLPELYTGADLINGKLLREDKLNPLTDSYKLITPEGIAQSMNPFISVLAQDALHSPSYGAKASMGAYGELEQSPNILQTLMNAYSSAPVVGAGGDIASGDLPGIASIAPASALSDKQYQKLLKRILATQRAQATVANGGYLVTDAVKRKPKAPKSILSG